MSTHEINVVMPSRLTAENGAKALLMGEFFDEYECSYYDEDGELVEYMKKVPVSWDTIKEIYKKIVAHYGTTPKTLNNKMKIFNIDFQKQAGKKFTQKINWIPWPLIHPAAKGVRVELLVRYKNGKVDFDWWDNDEENWTETIDPSTTPTGLIFVKECSEQEENMANWGIASTAPEIEKIKSEMADYLHGLNSCAEIDYSIYSQLFDFSLPLIQKAYELGKKEAQQVIQLNLRGGSHEDIQAE